MLFNSIKKLNRLRKEIKGLSNITVKKKWQFQTSIFKV